MQWLVSTGMVYKVNEIEKPAIPLSAHSNPGFFKLYMADTGLLRRMSRLPASAIFEESSLYSEFKGAMTENYVLNELVKLAWRSAFLLEVG